MNKHQLKIEHTLFTRDLWKLLHWRTFWYVWYNYRTVFENHTKSLSLQDIKNETF